ncbi:MAG TPA: hypothetical protein IAD45_06935 [Candidatus Faecimonas intestinavium]|jgi:hypothetical protein|nr:hypothetical protein [Candidatus Faecimonas intestinavium]
MEKVKILWSGITGRTGKEAVEIAKESGSVEISAGLSRSNENYYNYDELDNIKEDFDVIVDFSHKDSFDKVLDFALKVKKPIVIGTAGLTEEQMKRFEEASKIIPVFRGGNFRFDVKKFIDEVVEYAKKSEKESFDLIETHYKTKKVPSETAKVVAKRVLEETGKQVNIKSFLEYDELINDWKIDDLRCRVIGFKELAENVLEIARMMKDKTASGVYDLDRLLKEQELIDLHNFLIEAKKETYANENVEKVKSTRRGSHDYEYTKDNWTYHDTYFGGTDFQGQEVVYRQDDTPIWGMIYYGKTLDESLSEEAMDKALRPALMQVGQDDVIPVRGPKEFENQGYQYTFKVTGDLTSFEGEETIEKEGNKVYTLKCHGGIIRR